MRSAPSELARSALDAAPDAMIIIDSSGIIRFTNRQMSTLFGYGHDEMIGRGIEQLIPERFRARHVAHREGYLQAGRVRPMGAGLELYALRRDGTEFPVEISLSPLREGDRVLVAAAIRDITEGIRAKAEIVAARHAAERARETADEARAIADRANQGKSRFLATASHDLRQPLQTLALLNGSLRRLVSNPQALEAIAQQELAIGSMSRLLNALLDISKLESGAIRPEPADFTVSSLFEEMRNEFAGLAARKGLGLQVGSSTQSVHSDPSLVEQILRNLLSNAIKYTRQGRVCLRCNQQTDDRVRIEVLDTGVGIAADQLPHIYEEFYQVGVPANSTRDGYGLGLSIVQRLVRLLNLGFEVSSEVGRGTTFALVLPASHGRIAPHPAAAPPPSQRPQSGKTHILLVEDDLGVRDATRMLLKVEGYRVTAVPSLEEALEAARGDPAIDLVLTDYHLGRDQTGTQVIASLRNCLGTPVKAVLMTGDTSSAVRDLSLDKGIRIASKPIKAEELLGLLRGLLTE